MSETNQPRGLWNRSFVLLWQGQLASAAGDTIYQIALGFWILAETGSTGMMGALIGAGLLPRLLLAPIAGVLADRVSRRTVLVVSDLVAGTCVLAVGAAALAGRLEIWMLFAVGLIVGACSSFFFPAMEALVPEVAPRRKLVRANAALSFAHAAAGILGNGVGGFLFRVLGAPVLFLVNGATFVFSAISELFIDAPPAAPGGSRPGLRAELKAGLTLAWRDRGLRHLFAITALINFCGTLALFMLLPLFQRDAELGAPWYGALMGCFAGGGLLALLWTSLGPRIPLPRSTGFVVLGIVDSICVAAVPWLPEVAPMLVLIAISGFATAIENTFLVSALQAATPPSMRGKLFGLRETLVSGLVPAAVGVGGGLGELIDLPLLISGASAIVLLGFGAVVLSPAARQTLDFSDPAQSSAKYQA